MVAAQGAVFCALVKRENIQSMFSLFYFAQNALVKTTKY
jgi:hypothetical protein